VNFPQTTVVCDYGQGVLAKQKSPLAIFFGSNKDSSGLSVVFNYLSSFAKAVPCFYLMKIANKGIVFRLKHYEKVRRAAKSYELQQKLRDS
jgi:hypothetical protein